MGRRGTFWHTREFFHYGVATCRAGEKVRGRTVQVTNRCSVMRTTHLASSPLANSWRSSAVCMYLPILHMVLLSSGPNLSGSTTPRREQGSIPEKEATSEARQGKEQPGIRSLNHGRLPSHPRFKRGEEDEGFAMPVTMTAVACFRLIAWCAATVGPLAGVGKYLATAGGLLPPSMFCHWR